MWPVQKAKNPAKPAILITGSLFLLVGCLALAGSFQFGDVNNEFHTQGIDASGTVLKKYVTYSPASPDHPAIPCFWIELSYTRSVFASAKSP